LPEDPVLAAVAVALEEERHTAELLDADWRIRYVTTELRHMAGAYDDDELGYGVHELTRMVERPGVWRASAESGAAWFAKEAPYCAHDIETGIAAGDPVLEEVLAQAGVEALEPPPAWSLTFDTTLPSGLPISVSRVSVRLRRADGSVAGTAVVYVGGGGLRPMVQTMLTRGDPGMFERMIGLVEPARRPAAVLFADLAASGLIARHLSTRAYFDLIRTVTSAIDRAVIAEGGIIGKHVGDGVTAFFLAEQSGGEEAAAAAAVRAAHRIAAAVERIDTGQVEAGIKVGLHWGATLVIGQVTTEGRLEVTALGDEVNEAARIEQAASAGQILASKSLLERLDPAVAAELGVDPDALGYTILGEIPGVGEKVIRDAGGLAVAELPRRSRDEPEAS
jgi:class 3 adenylate cyclase